MKKNQIVCTQSNINTTNTQLSLKSPLPLAIIKLQHFDFHQLDKELDEIFMSTTEVYFLKKNIICISCDIFFKYV